ncbi:MAG: valine--tRNA ligase [Candidatus Neomarinimicrobiota bacterium]|nr:MAG: valine--tRNA ligase [Candidatus Neomarinimicrobiota bacterium]
MGIQLEKVYNPAGVEEKWYNHWLQKGYFHANPEKPGRKYSIVIPPPNVTGILTMGHVLNNTIQDILARVARMRGYETLWLPGTDHAGISTQVVVEKKLRQEGETRHDLGRERFVRLVWDWALKHKNIITTQLKKLGCSLDWERERFTLDEGLSYAVRKVFVDLYKKGLIYRGERIINWCPATMTALSDEEVIYRETEGHLWYFRYPLADEDGFIVVATTRPETMVGDTAVAVNPDDERYKRYIGKNVRLPIVGRVIPIIADEVVDPEFGTGAVKVTPAHDPVDFEISQRHGLEKVIVMNPDATMNENAGELICGKDRFEAREIVVSEMEKLGLLERVEDYVHNVGYSERAGVMVEPYLSEQWFVRMKPLAEPAIRVVREKMIKFHPERWYKTYFHWMENIKDWCISRQLWWGHRIPVFYCRECEWQDALMEDPDRCPKCGGEVYQDPDVLDTWFSSWLWPFSTMGWPEETPDLKSFYPTDDLVTGPDIIFFWVARMIMAGLEFMGDIPFRNVYFTGIIRDIQGRKMSKSLGNSPDPLVLIEKYGADALRFGTMLIAPQGQDILFSEERIEVGRNFMNKLWNASRFMLMNVEDIEEYLNFGEEDHQLELSDRWILSRLNSTIARVDEGLSSYRFDEVARIIYDFTWKDFCDWYIELIKKRLYEGTEVEKKVALKTGLFILRNLLKLLHPYAPFITEEIYQKIKRKDEPDIVVSSWPVVDSSRIDRGVENLFAFIQEVITSLRAARSEMNIPPQTILKLQIKTNEDYSFTEVLYDATVQDYVKRLVRVEDISISDELEKPHPCATVVVRGNEFYIPLEGVIDIDAERRRVEKEIKKVESFLIAIKKKLENENFIKKAPPEIVEREREKERANSEKLRKLKEHLKTLETL